MKLLEIDHQTIEDLRIFKRGGSEGVFDIYNQTKTRGGQKLLEEMFEKPLSDLKAISRRSEIVAELFNRNIDFPFSITDLDTAEMYTAKKEEASQNSYTLSEKETQKGVLALINIINNTKSFVDDPNIMAIENWYDEIVAIRSIVIEPVFVAAANVKPTEKLPFSAITAYDNLFRIRERDKIIQLLNHIFNIDVYTTVAKVARINGFCFAKALKKGTCILNVEGVFQPGLKNAVSNDFSSDAKRNILFLTGANMAGKSTFLRAISTAVYIAHMGFPVAATAMEFSVMDGIYTTINLPDKLGIGASHFYVEVLRLKKVANELDQGKSIFVLFDELFRGTNVMDAHEASVAVIKAFSTRNNSVFIISSHIVEAAEELESNSKIAFKFLPTTMQDNVPRYTYKLQNGVTEDRHGMLIINNEGILEILANGNKLGTQMN